MYSGCCTHMDEMAVEINYKVNKMLHSHPGNMSCTKDIVTEVRTRNYDDATYWEDLTENMHVALWKSSSLYG